MIDKEKVIKALEFCSNQRIVDTCYGECPYAVADDEYKCLEMKLDALDLLKEQQEQIDKLLEESASNAEIAEGMRELLKEQEAVKPTWGRGKPFCGACGLRIHGGKFCSECGKPILWEGR